MKSKLISKNVTVNGRRTSLRLEGEIWDALHEICNREHLTLHELCTMVEAKRNGGSRTSTLRAFIVTYFRTAAHQQLADSKPVPQLLPEASDLRRSRGLVA